MEPIRPLATEIEHACVDSGIDYELRIVCPNLIGAESGLCLKSFKMRTLNPNTFREEAARGGWLRIEGTAKWLCPNCRSSYAEQLRGKLLGHL